MADSSSIDEGYYATPARTGTSSEPELAVVLESVEVPLGLGDRTVGSEPPLFVPADPHALSRATSAIAARPTAGASSFTLREPPSEKNAATTPGFWLLQARA
jgi:hypothetical protein